MSDWGRFLPSLTRDETDELVACAVTDGVGRRTSLGELLAGWSAHVRRFESEAPLTADDEGVWTEHDYLGALHLRDRLTAALHAAPGSTRALGERILAEADGRFRDLTEADECGLLARVLPAESLGAGWWWSRVPRMGPVREGLERLRR